MTSLPVLPLSDVADISAGITLGRKTKESQLIEVPYLRVANVQDGHLLLGELKMIAATRREAEKWALKDGDLLLTEGGDLDKLGRGACWREQLPLCIHQNHIFRVRLPADRYDADFVSFQIGSPYGKAYFLAHAKKTTGIASINQRVLGAFPLVSPPIDEQRRITARLKAQLAEVDRARQAAQTQLRDAALLQRRLLQAAFHQLVCEPLTLGCVLNEIQTGKSFLTAEVLARPDELGVLKVSAVSWSQFRADQAKALKGEYTPAENHRVKQGDLLISRANTRELVGAVVLVERDYPMRLLSDKTLRLVVDESRANKDYLLLALRTELAREHIELYATGTSDSMRNISQDVIASIPILLPPLDDQCHIVARLKSQLDETDNMAQSVTAQLAEIERLPQHLLSQTFNNVGARS